MLCINKNTRTPPAPSISPLSLTNSRSCTVTPSVPPTYTSFTTTATSLRYLSLTCPPPPISAATSWDCCTGLPSHCCWTRLCGPSIGNTKLILAAPSRLGQSPCLPQNSLQCLPSPPVFLSDPELFCYVATVV